MVVVCPCAQHKQQIQANEVRLRFVIAQLSQFLYDQIIDVFTSRKEVGTVNETFVYVRFPYYMMADLKCTMPHQ